MQLTTDINSAKETFLDLERQASEPYSRFVYEDYSQFDKVRRFLFERDLCEFSPPFGRVLVDKGLILGMMACLGGEDLVRCRLRAALAISKLDCVQQDKELRRRFQLASSTLVKPKAGDYYLSRIAVAKAMRHHGIGGYLLKEFEAEGRRLDRCRLILEVDPRNQGAISLYRKRSFEEGEVCRITDPVSGRSLEYLPMFKVLSNKTQRFCETSA